MCPYSHIFQLSGSKTPGVPDGGKSDGQHQAERSKSKENEDSKPSKTPAEMPYRCIVCNEDLSYKGVCKRHLDEQHVTPNVFQCERCNQCFDTKAEAKKHCNRCGMGNFHWNVVKPPAKTIYASEYTDEWFSSKSMYLEHLLKLSKKGSTRPKASLNRKLRTLLGHPSLVEHVIDMSEVTLGLGDAWKRLRWSDTQLQLAIQQLEDAAVVHENGIITFEGHTQPALNVRHFLHALISAGTLSDVQSHPGSPPPQQSDGRHDRRRSSVSTAIRRSTLGVPGMSAANASAAATLPSSGYALNGTIAAQQSAPTRRHTSSAREMRAKRHRSDLSGSTEATRKAPGPPRTPVGLQYPPAAHVQVLDPRYGGLGSTVLPERPMVDHISQQYAAVNGLASQPQAYDLMSPATTMQPPDLDSTSSVGTIPQEPDMQYAPPPPQPPAPAGAYNLWPQDGLEFQFDAFKSVNRNMHHDPGGYGYPSDSSTRASIVSYFDSSEDEQQHSQQHPQQGMTDYAPYLDYGVVSGMGTFLLDDDEQNEMSALNQRFSGF